MSRTVPCPPGGGILDALISMSGVRLLPNLCEFLDNSFGANATCVEADWGPGAAGESEFLRVWDDGMGCDNMRAIFRLGEHDEKSSRDVGRFGTGGSMAHAFFCAADGKSEIESFCERVRRAAAFDWRAVRDGADWKFEEEEERPQGDSDRGGTKIVVRPAKRAPDKGDRWNSMLSELGYIYMPALVAGKQLKLRRHPKEPWSIVRPWQLPRFEPGDIDKTICVGRKRLRIRVGIVANRADNTRPGLHFVYGFRVLTNVHSLGCEGYATGNVAGIVELEGRDWPVTLNKDDFVPCKETDAIAAAIFAAIQPLLLAAQQKAMDFTVAKLTDSLTVAINGLVERARAKRKVLKGATGAVAPVGDGAPHTQAEVEQPGERWPSSRPIQGPRAHGRRYVIEWQPFEPKCQPVRMYDQKAVHLNESNMFALSLRDAENESALLVLIATAIGDQLKSDRSRKAEPLFAEMGLLATIGEVLGHRVEGAERSGGRPRAATK